MSRYSITVSVYLTEPVNYGSANVNVKTMLEALKEKVAKYPSGSLPRGSNSKKAKEIYVHKIEAHEHINKDFGEIILLEIIAGQTKIVGREYQGNEIQSNVEASEYINNHYFYLLIPHCETTSDDITYTHYVIMYYEDPNKEKEDVDKIAKQVVLKILGEDVTFKLFAPKIIIDELKKIQNEIEVTLSVVSESSSENNSKYKEYSIVNTITSESISTTEKDVFYILGEKFEGLLEQFKRATPEGGEKKRTMELLPITNAEETKLQYKIELENNMKAVFEKMLSYKIPIEKNTTEIFKHEFIVDKLMNIYLECRSVELNLVNKKEIEGQLKMGFL